MTERDTLPPPPQEHDAPNVAKAVVIAAGTLAVFAVGIAWVIVILRSRPEPPDAFRAPQPNELRQPEIGIVDQPPFEGDTRLESLQEGQRRHLATYGWVDRDAGTIHIPIERAMELLVAEHGR
jgi:hypothetical protein